MASAIDIRDSAFLLAAVALSASLASCRPATPIRSPPRRVADVDGLPTDDAIDEQPAVGEEPAAAEDADSTATGTVDERPVESADPASDAVAAYQRTLDAWNALLAHGGDPAFADAYVDNFDDPIACGAATTFAAVEHRAAYRRRPRSTYNTGGFVGTWNVAWEVLRSSPEIVVLHSYRASVVIPEGAGVWERFVELRRVDGRWLISKDAGPNGLDCIESSDRAVTAGAQPPPEISRCRAAHRRCLERCANECEHGWERFGLLAACHRCSLDVCPCELARCLGNSEMITRICEGMR